MTKEEALQSAKGYVYSSKSVTITTKANGESTYVPFFVCYTTGKKMYVKISHGAAGDFDYYTTSDESRAQTFNQMDHATNALDVVISNQFFDLKRHDDYTVVKVETINLD